MLINNKPCLIPVPNKIKNEKWIAVANKRLRGFAASIETGTAEGQYLDTEAEVAVTTSQIRKVRQTRK